jgi:hypothetical protein
MNNSAVTCTASHPACIKRVGRAAAAACLATRVQTQGATRLQPNIPSMSKSPPPRCLRPAHTNTLHSRAAAAAHQPCQPRSCVQLRAANLCSLRERQQEEETNAPHSTLCSHCKQHGGGSADTRGQQGSHQRCHSHPHDPTPERERVAGRGALLMLAAAPTTLHTAHNAADSACQPAGTTPTQHVCVPEHSPRRRSANAMPAAAAAAARLRLLGRGRGPRRPRHARPCRPPCPRPCLRPAAQPCRRRCRVGRCRGRPPGLQVRPACCRPLGRRHEGRRPVACPCRPC